jgi:hypothetical protein
VAQDAAARLRWLDPAQPPPDGLMFEVAEQDPQRAILAARGKLWGWTPSGYEGPLAWDGRREARLLTPPSTAAAVANGYAVQIHPSALR